MTTTAVANLAQISNKASALTPAEQKKLAAYVSAGSAISATDEILLSEITRNPGRTVQEYITLVSSGATKNERIALTVRYNRLLRKTLMGRNLSTNGLVLLSPLSGRPYWFLDIQNLVGN
ncbi:MAG: hypothetical protein EOP83_34895, partial [Verrucomicrobiaceae bacterium]